MSLSPTTESSWHCYPKVHGSRGGGHSPKGACASSTALPPGGNLTTDLQARAAGVFTTCLRKHLQTKGQTTILLFLFVRPGSKSFLGVSQSQWPSGGRKVCTLRLFHLYFLSFSYRRHSGSRTEGSPEVGEQLPWALRSPCGASFVVAESQRGQAPAAWSGWPGCWRSGKRGQRRLLGCPFGVRAWQCSPGGSAAWRGWLGC